MDPAVGKGVKDPSCPVCLADVPLSGDERAEDEVHCTYCGAPLKISGLANGEDLDLEEAF